MNRAPISTRGVAILVIFLLLATVAVTAARWGWLRVGLPATANDSRSSAHASVDRSSSAPVEGSATPARLTPGTNEPWVGEAANAEGDAAEVIVELDRDQWQASGIELATATAGEFSKSVQLTGKVALNQDHVAHIYPLVEGTVDSVSVALGQQVKANDLLVVIHSREIGEAKLQLYQARLQHQMAVVKDELQKTISHNARELVEALRQQRPITQIQETFRDRPMGDYRERLVSSYANYIKSEADVSRLQGLVAPGAVSAKQLLAAESNRNADLATFQARIEQVSYEIETSLLLSSQSVRESATQVAVAETSLRILGYEQDDLDDIDPAQQGESISHYPIRAPFDGTVLDKDIVLSEQVRPDGMVLVIADLSTVWITTDVYESHVPLMESLEGKRVRIHSEAYPERRFEAEVFYTGEVMDESSRTIAMRAIADNQDRMLKPGMFVKVDLPVDVGSGALLLPKSAVLQHEGEVFVFVHLGDDRFLRRAIVVGESNPSTTQVMAGLSPDESVVVQGGFVLKSLMLADLMGEE